MQNFATWNLCENKGAHTHTEKKKKVKLKTLRLSCSFYHKLLACWNSLYFALTKLNHSLMILIMNHIQQPKAGQKVLRTFTITDEV